MRQPEDMGWYSELGADGEPRAVHGIKRLMPEGSKEITAEQAAQISKDVRARAPQHVSAPLTASAPAPTVDLKPIQDQITALATVVQGHAAALDTQAQEVKAVKASTDHFMAGLSSLTGKPA